jgi:hypothetical protein
MKRVTLGLAVVVLLAGLMLLPARPATADKTVVVNNYYGDTPFLYGGYSYIPIRNVQEALGAALLWDSLKNRAVITYNGHELGLVVGSPVCYLDGAPRRFPVAPVIVNNYVFVPSAAIRDCLHVPMEYDSRQRKLKVRGPGHWSVFSVNPTPKPAVVVQLKKHEKKFAPPGQVKKKGGAQDKGKGKAQGKGTESKGKGKGKDK